MAMGDRFKPLQLHQLDPHQRAIFETIASGPRGSVPWIFHLYLESPEAAARIQKLGAFCRYGTGLPPHLSELAILVVAKHWDAAYEWSVHAKEALKAGIQPEIVAAIEEGVPPDFADSDSALIFAFSDETLRLRDVSDATFDAAVARFGRPVVVELAALIGYYSMLAIAMRVFRLPPEDADICD